MKKYKSVRFHNNTQVYYPGETVGYIEVGSNQPKHAVDSIEDHPTNPNKVEWTKGKHQGTIWASNISHSIYFDKE